MKNVHSSRLLALIGLFFLGNAFSAIAQDDLYYDPATDRPATPPATYTDEYQNDNNVTRRYDDDDEYYYEDDDYAYEYSSRIRRFHRRSVVVDYYDPFFVDMYNYDPFYSPGMTIYVSNYNDYWTWRRWRRWQRWNSWNSWDYGWGWNAGWNAWGWNSCYRFNSPWYNPWVVNNYYYDPYWTWNGYNPYFNNGGWGNGWVHNHYYYNNNNNGGGGGYSPRTYTGPRRGGTQGNPGYARIADNKGRLAPADNNAPTIEKTAPRPGRTATDMDPGTAVGRTKQPSTPDRTVTPDNAGGRRPQDN
ncbi:MAG TPA: hypothetical protein VK168_19520, partial [Saprospiraceae bacterium]|nr:hypothetical protein [Saprospiraceae bacterium]